MRTLPAKFGIVCGLVAILVFLVMYSVAMSLDDEYTFFENYLSDLGVGPGAWAFNSALVITGALLAVFSMFGLAHVIGGGRLSRLATILLALSGLLLMGVGIFNEDFDPHHYIFSVSYFLTFLVALIIITISLYKSRALGRFGVIVSASACLFGALLVPMGGNPESETLAVLAMIVWGLLISCAALLREYGRSVP